MVRGRFLISDLTPLPETICREFDIVPVPHPLRIDGREYPNNALPFTHEEFGRMLLTGRHTFETAVTPPEVYAAIYREIPPDTPIYVICFSGKISAFHAAARLAADAFPERDITVIETPFCPPVMTLWALTAARLAAETATNTELKPLVTALGRDMGVYHALFSLEYLRQTGRINAAKAFIGRMIKLVPVITTDRDGHIVPAAKTRRIEKSLARICELVARDIEGRDAAAIDILVTYTGTEANGRRLMDNLQTRFPVRHSLLVQGSFSMLRHLGPDAAGLAYYVSRGA